MKKPACIFCLVATLLLVQTSFSQVPDSIGFLKGFKNPSSAYAPRVWWHWTASNITKEGITRDLEWMKRVGIGGFQAFDVSFGSGQSVNKKIKYMTPEWLELIKHTASEADRLGLEMTMVTAAGWSETGGVTVKPAEAMKKIVWSQLVVQGGKKINEKLPMPASITGPFRNLKKPASFFGTGAPDPKLYQDQLVLAYKTPEAELINDIPVITNNKGEAVSSKELLDDDLNSSIDLDVPKEDAPVYLQYEYAQPTTIRSYSLCMGGAGGYPSSTMRPGYLQYSGDGKSYKTIVSIPGPQHDIRALAARTFSFAPVTAKYFRVVFIKGSAISTVGGPDDIGGFGGPSKPKTSFQIAESILRSAARVNRWEDKANFAPFFDFTEMNTAPTTNASVIDVKNMIDISSKLKSDGTLEWEVPAGSWTILRMGYSLTGAKNGPAIPEATGLEVDKLNKDHLLSYINQWSKPIQDAMGPLFGKSMKYFLVDSYEADAQNWTENMVAEFKKRRGYDPVKYLPALAGLIVESSEVSDRFLWDYRLVIAEMLVDQHYAALTEIAHQKGIKTYGEVAGISLPIIQDALRNRGNVDIPMAEFGMSQGLGSGEGKAWTSPADLENQQSYNGASDRLNAHQADIREAASAAHIYGKKIVAAESWTGGGYEAPEALKFIGDYWATQGVNQFVFHTSAHQPLDTKPGNTMVGTHFHRNITWAEQAKPFVQYLTRNEYMLQEGRFIADIAYYLGEDIPSSVPYWEKLRYEIPAGYDNDFVNTEILNRFTVENGELVLPTGMRYKVLVLPEKTTMSLVTLEKIESLIKEGAVVIGPKPQRSAGLEGYPAIDEVIAAKANAIWGAADGKFTYKNNYGKGKVYWNIPLTGIFGQMGLLKDLDYTKPHVNTSLNWMHRKNGDIDYYMLLNMRNQAEDIEVNFRVAGKKPSVWNSTNGTVQEISYRIENGITIVKLHLDPLESVFVVFDQTTSVKEQIVSPKKIILLSDISNDWQLNFPDNWGAPKQVMMPVLGSWTANENAGVKYFSGTASYSKTITIDKSKLLPGSSIQLNLGKVKDIAEVFINGKLVETLWKSPYTVNISKEIKPGKNLIEVKVTNQWDNRIAGDAELPAGKKILSSSGSIFSGPAKAKESGMLGPVLLFHSKN